MKKEYEKKDYSYDKIFSTTSTQDNLFDITAKPVIDVIIFFFILQIL